MYIKKRIGALFVAVTAVAMVSGAAFALSDHPDETTRGPFGESAIAPGTTISPSMEAHEPAGAVVRFDDNEGLLLVPTKVVPEETVLSAICIEEKKTRARIAEDKDSPASSETITAINAMLAVFDCDVSGLHLTFDGENINYVIAVNNDAAVTRLEKAIAALPGAVTGEVIADIPEVR